MHKYFNEYEPNFKSEKGQTELFMITNMSNSLITIMIPSESSVYEDDTLPDLTQKEDIRTGNYIDISDRRKNFHG